MNRCNYRNWPIRRQLMFSFLCTTFILQLIILVVIFVNLEVMIKETDSQVQNQVESNVDDRFGQMAQQLANSFQTQIYLLMNQLGLIRQFFIQFFNPLNTYEGNSNYQMCQNQQMPDYDYFCVYIPPQANQLTNVINPIIQKIADLNYFLPSIITQFIRTQIERVQICIYEPSQNVIIYLIYPSTQIINTNIDIIQFYDYEITPPFIDPFTNKTSISCNLGYNTSDYAIQFSIVIGVTDFIPLFYEINYYQTTEIAITDQSGTLIYAPFKWNTNYDTQLQKIYNFSDYSGFDISSIPIYNMTSVSKYGEQYQLFRYSTPVVYDDLELSSYVYGFSNQSQFYFYLYAERLEMLETYYTIQSIVQRIEAAIILLSVCSSIFTIAVVFIFTYYIAVKISRPLTKLTGTAAYMSNNATKKNITQEITEELKRINAENQIAELINSFQQLVDSIDNKNKNKQSAVRKNFVQYPLNQYDPEFIQKTKNKSDINWHNELDKIEDE